MNASQMLHKMCHEVLSNADVKAICKSRGFSTKETASRALFENFFLSDIGVEATIGSLTKEETVLLHLLKFIGDEVDISFFARIYADKQSQGSYYYQTFTQRYKDVFKKVRTSLVRKGVLLIAEASAWQGDTKIERWRFRFPREFERFLPPLIKSTRTFEESGDVKPAARHKLMEVVGGRQPPPAKSDKQYRLKIVAGELRMGNEVFRAGRLSEWQRACWEASVPSPKKREKGIRASSREKTISPIKAAVYVFSQLEENEWIHPGQLGLPLRVFCDAHLSGEEVCKTGWQWGYLAKQEADGDTYYRLPKTETAIDVSPERYLYAASGHRLAVNLETVPYNCLELLVQIANVQVADLGQPHLTASPDTIKMGHALESIRNHPLTQWLRENAPDFRQALETVEQRWGKQIIHENLLIAHVGDLILRVQLERAFPDSEAIVFLPNDYIAFPYHLLAAVEKVIAKSGHVIRTVQQNG